MTGSWAQPKKVRKLERKNATKNVKFEPEKEGLSSNSLPHTLRRNGSDEFEDSLRLFGNNVDEEIERICSRLGVSRLELLGITPAAWQNLSERRSHTIPSSSDHENPMCTGIDGSHIVESFPLLSSASWPRADSELLDCPSTDQDQPSQSSSELLDSLHGKIPVPSDKQKNIFTYSLWHKSDEELFGSSLTARSKVSNGEPVGGLSHKSLVTDTSKYDSEFDSSLIVPPQDKTTVPSSLSRQILKSGTALQLVSENIPQEKAPLTYQQNLQLQSNQAYRNQHPSEGANTVLQNVSLNNVGASLKLMPMSTALGTEPDKSSNLEVTLEVNSTDPDATSQYHGDNEWDHNKPIVDKTTAKCGTEDIIESRSVTLAHPTNPMDVKDEAAEGSKVTMEEPMNSVMEVSSSDIKHVNNMLQNPTQMMSQVRPRVPWSFWKKGGLLGSGSFGTVYEGFNSEGLFFAVKEVSLNDEGRGGQESISQLEQEIEILSQFQHDNIVKYLGTQREQRKLYIFLEFMPKGALSSLYKKIPLFDSQVRSYTRQILSGLKYLHEREIVHRDIKCANILVHTNGVVKLADFGMAKVLRKSEQLKSLKGSACWMAPEVINPKMTYSLPADIWSLGCAVLEMATGNPPFGDLEWQIVLWKVGHGEAPPIPDRLPDEAKNFIQLCLQVDPSVRPTAAALLEHPFVKPRFLHLTSIHSSTSPVLVESADSLVDYDSVDPNESIFSETLLGTSSSSGTDSRDDEARVDVANSKSPARSVRTRRSSRVL